MKTKIEISEEFKSFIQSQGLNETLITPKFYASIIDFCHELIVKNNVVLGDVSGSPSFEDWLNKYFETPKMKMMYRRKDGKGEYDIEKLIRDYKRAFRQF